MGGCGLLSCAVFEAIAFAGDLDDLGMMEEAVEDGGSGGDVSEEFAPLFDGAVGGHEGGAHFVTTHDDLEEVFSALGGQLLDAHVVDDEQIATEVGFERFLVTQGMFALGTEFGDGVEDRTVEDVLACFDQGVADGLGEVAFANSGRADEEHIAALSNEFSAGQLVNLPTVYLGIEGEVEGFEGAQLAEGGGFGAPGDTALASYVEFVIEDEFEEFVVRQVMAFGLFEA